MGRDDLNNGGTVSQPFALPATIRTEKELEEIVSRPTPDLVESMAALSGDLLILGVGGKLGPDLAHLALRAIQEAGVSKRVIGVSRFSAPTVRKKLEAWGAETIAADLLRSDELEKLPDAENVIFLIGRKFGTGGAESQTWAWNTFLPGLVARRFRASRIVALSSGNVYPFVPIASGGADESVQPDPVGEYGQSVLGRERLFEFFSRRYETPGVLIRLNYSNSLTYGVLVDIGQKILAGQAIDLAASAANFIWQGDTNRYILRSFEIAASPPTVLNLTGPETVSIRWAARELARRLDKEPRFVNQETETALLNNAAFCFENFGYPVVPLKKILDWVADWLLRGGITLDRPTHFEEREGKF